MSNLQVEIALLVFENYAVLYIRLTDAFIDHAATAPIPLHRLVG